MKSAKFRVFAACLCIVALTSGLLAREQSTNPVARKFYELKDYGLIYPSCDFKLGINHFRENGLQKEPNARAYIIGYKGKRALSKPFRSYLDQVENWLNFAEGVPREKIVVIDGGYRDQPIIELWIVPEGAAAPEPSPTFSPKKRRKR
ncbi:MAG: hypothetical protein M3430_07850 [Acidobacteriota bacterium]|nr:hypothetical protein [Acidobacteriota bacterium]